MHCISAAKAQAAGCACVTSDAFALNETIKYGNKIHTDCEKWGKENTFGDNLNRDKYVSSILEAKPHEKQIQWAKETFNWDNISNSWNKEL